MLEREPRWPEVGRGLAWRFPRCVPERVQNPPVRGELPGQADESVS